MENFDAIIIGGGPAGMFAGIYGYQKKLNLLLIEKEGFLGGTPLTFANKFVYDFPCFNEITAKDLVNKLVDQLMFNTKTKVLTNTTIVSYIYKNNVFEIMLSSGIAITVNNIIIATGNMIEIFNDIEVNSKNRINVKINQETNLSHIYAIGNVCYYQDKPSSMSTAIGEATVAIRSIVNQKK